MSGNIKDTDVNVIRRNIEELTTEIEKIVSRQEDPSQFEYSLKKKYNHLSNTSPTLFKFILKSYATPTFNKEFFDKTINLMLSKISTIQNSNDTSTSQHTASEHIGTHLAQEFIAVVPKGNE